MSELQTLLNFMTNAEKVESASHTGGAGGEEATIAATEKAYMSNLGDE